MKYLSVCSGIEAATCAWHPLGWEPFAFSEIEKFPSKVLAHHYPTVPNLGDMTKFKEWPDATIDLLVGGTPCQSFSVAGLRKGLDDPRGNLMLTYGAIAAKYRPKWLVWENVPGVLSSNGGRDFGTFLGMLGQLGYGFAYAVRDAQYFGVAQRRRRVFVVGCLGDWRSAAAVLFERHGLQGNPAPSREAGKGIANCLTDRADRGGGNSEGQRLIAHTLRAQKQPSHRADSDTYIPCQCLRASKGGGDKPHVLAAMQVRRLTPVECERLQGFADDYTLLPGNKADGPRYKALGNSMAVPVMAWIGKRIQMVDEIQLSNKEAA